MTASHLVSVPRPNAMADDSHLSAVPTQPMLNLAGAALAHAQSQPAAPALIVGDRTWTYAGLGEVTTRVGGWLRASAGNAPRVGILASRSLETYAGILGAACAGGTYVPINPRQPAARIASILERARLSALIVDAAAAAHLADSRIRGSLPPHVLTSVSPDATGDASSAGFPVPVASDHAAYIMFTSGTTGVPKGVVVTAGNVACFLSAVREQYGIHPGDRAGQFCETSFDVSVFEMFAAWAGGACVVVVPESQLMAPAGFIRREKLTVWTSVPSVIAMLSRMKMLDAGMFPSLRVSFFIGEALPAKAARDWQAAAPASVVDNQYGPTEATVACTVQRVADPLLETPGRGTVAIGRPYPEMEAEVVGEGGRFLSDGEIGELALSGPQLAAGYLDDDEQTARRFPELDHPRLGRRRWYRTGDLAYRDEAGVLHCLGRTDHQVKIMGHRVELEDLEAHLRAASGTDAVTAIAWPVVSGNAAGVAAFVCGANVPVAAIRDRLRELVPPYMVPRRIVEVDELPRSANGKIDRAALGAMLDETR